MSFPNADSGHQRVTSGSSHHNSSHHRARNAAIPEDEEVSERSDFQNQYGYGYDSDDNTSFTESYSTGTPNSNWMTHKRSTSDPFPFRDQITIFQAAPLAGMTHGLSKDLVPIAELHLEQERHELERIFRNTRVAVEFQIATHESLGKFLETNEGTKMHFSCHGDAGCLFLEDDWGGLAPLAKEDLQKWVQNCMGGRELNFVFVSACYSQLVGQAFVNAGVPHVVCSREDAKLMVGVSALFEKTFYRNLAQQKTVKESFDIAIQATVSNSTIPDELRQREVEKYCLLPKDADHNVPVFFQPPRQGQQQQPTLQLPAIPGPPSLTYKQERNFPPPPKVFIGRAVDQYKILQLVKHSRLTCVHGPAGMGKSALVKAVCQYVHYRRNMMDFSDGIQWIDTSQDHLMMLRSEESEQLQPVIDLIHASNSMVEGERIKPNRKFLQEAGENILKLVGTFGNRKTLLVVDAKKITKKDALRKLGIFLEEFIRQTQFVKVIVIYKEEEDIKNSRLRMEHQTYAVGPLSFEWSVKLFARLFPEQLLKERHYGIGTKQELCEVLYPSSTNPTATLTPRQKMLWTMMGSGDPLCTINVAKTFAKDQYDDLLILCATNSVHDLTLDELTILDSKIVDIEKRKAIYERQGNLQNVEQCRQMLHELDRQKEAYSRANLEQRQKELQKEIDIATNEENYRLALELQLKHEQLETIKVGLLTLIELENKREELEFEIKLCRKKDLLKAQQLQNELKFTIKSIKAERRAFGDTDDVPESRALLEARIMKMESEKERCVTAKKFDKAGELKPEIDRLKEMRSMVPAAADWRIRIRTLSLSLDKAIKEEDFASADTLQKRIEALEKKLETEEKAEKDLGVAVPSAMMSNVERRSIAAASSVASRRSGGIDPGDDPLSVQPPALKPATSSDPPGMALRTESRRSDPLAEGKKGCRNRYSTSDFSLRPPVRSLPTMVAPTNRHDSVSTTRHSNVTRGSQSSQGSGRPDPSDSGISMSAIGPGAYAVRGNSSCANEDEGDDQGSAFSAEEATPSAAVAVAQSAPDERDIVLPPIMGTATAPLPNAMEVVNGIVEHQDLLEQQIVQIMKKHAVPAESVVPVADLSDRDISVDFSAYTNSSRDTDSLRECMETEEKKGGMKGLFKKLRNRKS